MNESLQRDSLALDTLAEFKSEVTSPPSQLLSAPPTLDNVLARIGTLPRKALFLGIASDALPVLLNLHDPLPGPILIVGDPGSGKTNFLRTITHSLTMTHQPSEVQFSVITARPEEWDREMESSYRVAIFPASHNGTQDLLLSLSSWAHKNKNPRQSVLLFIDDLESVAEFDFDALQNLRWLLLRGPSRRVWPILTMNAMRYGNVISWIPTFRTRIFGKIADRHVASALGGDSSSALDSLQAGSQFSIRENGGWLRFWLPGS